MLKVGLTGSIAVGKSFVLRVLRELGCYVIDADATAREVVAPGRQGLNAVIEAFGSEILKEDRTLDRAKLGSMVFADEAKRLQLNSILHPFIIAVQDAQHGEQQEFVGHGARDVANDEAGVSLPPGKFGEWRRADGSGKGGGEGLFGVGQGRGRADGHRRRHVEADGQNSDNHADCSA